MKKHLVCTLLVVVFSTAAVAGDRKLRVVLLDGQNNHKWEVTSPFLKQVLEDSGRFTVEYSTNINPKDKRYEGLKNVNFPPDLRKYDVIVSNYNGGNWPKEFNDQLDDALKSGRIGLVIVHAANNSFGGWKEYNLMIGMGWRGKSYGKRLKYDDAGKAVLVDAGLDLDTGHRYTGPFKIVVRDPNHPVTKGMPLEWMHAQDELYDNLRGPIENVHVLATGYAPGGKGTGVHEPMIFTISYGKGRVFHTPMGHDLNGMRCVGFVATLLRGTEWAATGKVSIPLPSNFPSADRTSSVSAK
ncbi:MAG: ThuA domain-containing protein [Gemmataceae bacterium]|nr:ThuA domain-containing protein [Gemmataceae bacterium]MCI0738545.1 ThuA domain-containing protein [Gemmataceae bacterium]